MGPEQSQLFTWFLFLVIGDATPAVMLRWNKGTYLSTMIILNNFVQAFGGLRREEEVCPSNGSVERALDPCSGSAQTGKLQESLFPFISSPSQDANG